MNVFRCVEVPKCDNPKRDEIAFGPGPPTPDQSVRHGRTQSLKNTPFSRILDEKKHHFFNVLFIASKLWLKLKYTYA